MISIISYKVTAHILGCTITVCDGGQINEIQIKHKKVRAKPVVSSTHIQDRKGCQKKCLKQKR